MNRRSRAILVAAGAFTLLAAATPAAQADPVVAGEFDVSGVGTNNELTTGPDGNIWVTLDQTNDVARITPDGTVTQFNPANVTNPTGITSGPDGNLWVTQPNEVASFSPADPNAAVKFAVGALADPRGIVTGPDGNLWTASGNNVIRIPPANPVGFTAFPVVVGARDIDAGGDGNLWVADFGGNQVVSVTTAGVPTAYPTGGGSGAQAITAGPNNQIAYADPTSNPQLLGRITPGGATETTATAGDPFGVAFGADGAYWFPRFATGDLARLTTDGQVTTLAGLSAGAGPRRITAGPGNTLWVTLETANKIAKIASVDPPVVDPPGVDPPPPGTAPETTLDKAPKNKVEAKKATGKAKVKFKFSATGTAPSFQCTLTKKGKKPKVKACTSPAKYELKPARYTFAVAATADGLADESPATTKFRVVEP